MRKSHRSRTVAGVFLAFIFLGAAALLHFASPAHASKAAQGAIAKPSLSSISLPLFFEPNQGQTDPRVKFLARGSGYGLFLTSDEAVLEVQQSGVSNQHSAVAIQHQEVSSQLAARSSQPVTSIVRMHLEGANPAAKIAGSDLLPGKSNYFVGNDPNKWRRNIPQFARVNYTSVYPGVDLIYYGNQGQLEYDFRVAPGADPKQIALKFEGAAPKLEHGDLVLSTRAGDVRFHAPNVYQQDGGKRLTIEAGFRLIANDKIGFEIGAYDHSRELVIDPVLFFSTWLGGGGESNVQVALDAGFNIYVAGSTTSAAFPVLNPISCPPNDCSKLNGAQNIFVSKISPPTQNGAQLVFSTYLGGELSDTATGVAADNAGNIYVAGWTTSTTFPTTPNAFQGGPPAVAGIHGFLSKISLFQGVETLNYSTYLAGNLGSNPGSRFDKITGLAVDKTNDAFVTGITTSTDQPNDPGNPSFPASANGFQTQSAGGAIQFFASKINTGGSGASSMLYSTYFGGSSAPSTVNAVGGGIALDPAGNMYFTGGTNYIGGAPTSPPVFFPVQNAQQECLNQAGIKSGCVPPNGNLDAFIAKINPNVVGLGGLQYSTFLGGAGNDVGLAIAVDSSSNAYITGETSTDNSAPPNGWNQPTSITGFQTAPGALPDAFIAKLGPLTSGIYPIVYFTYIGGSGEDIGHGITIDSTFAAHVTGSTQGGLPITSNNLQDYGGGSTDAFVGLISTTASGVASGDYLTYLGGLNADEGTAIALDASNTTYVAGDTQSGLSFPTKNPIQQPNGTNAFVSQITTQSHFSYTNSTPSASPNPGDMGSQVTFTFTWVNDGQETANNVAFAGTLTGTSAGQGFTFSSATATPGGACANPQNGNLLCNVGDVPAGSNVTVTVVMVPTCTSESQCPSSLTVEPNLIANRVVTSFNSFSVPVNDFALTPAPSPLTQTVTAGGSTSYTVSLSACTAGGTSCGPNSGATYTNSISMSATITPANSTITTTFTPTSVTISGTGPNTTSLSVATQPRPVSTGSRLRRHGPVYATWLPVGGLSLLGLGVGASRRRRRWMAGALLGLIAGIVLLQGACGSSSSNTAQTGGTPAGTYTIKITGTSGSTSHLAQVQLVVN